MTVQKVSVSLEHGLVQATRERVGGRGLSAYVNEALRRQLRRDALAELLADLHDEHGPVPDNYMEEVRLLWPVPGELAKPRPA